MNLFNEINNKIEKLTYLRTKIENNPASIERILENSKDHDVAAQSLTLTFFCFSSLIIGTILKEVKNRTNIPYTPMVLIVGALIAYYHNKLGKLGESMKEVSNIDPHTLLVIFIPGLLFEGSYNTHGYTFNKSKWQVLMLAGPGVIVTALLLAYSFKYLFFYNLTISEALVIG